MASTNEAANPSPGGRIRQLVRWSAACVVIVTVWLVARCLRLALPLESIGAVFVLDWLGAVCAVALGGAAHRWIGASRFARPTQSFPWIAPGLLITLWWFPIALDQGHRAVYYRSVLRLPAGMFLAVWLLARLAAASRSNPARWKTRLSEALLLLSALGLPLVALETYYRWTLPTVAAAGDPYDRCTETWLRLYDPNLDPALRHTPRGRRRFRDEPEPGPKPPGQQRVLFVGDSITYGWGVDRESDLMSSVTERLLQRRAGPDVLTGSIATFNVETVQQIELMRQFGFGWDPDVLVLVHDLSDIAGEAGNVPSPQRRRPGPIMTWLIRRSFLASRLYWTHAFRSGLSENHLDWLVKQYNDPQVGPDHLRVLARLLKDCRRREIKVLLVLSPFLSAVEHYPEDLRSVHQTLAAFGREQGASVLDGLNLFAGTRSLQWMVNRADRHPNAAAHRRYAQRITEALVPLLQRKRPDPPDRDLTTGPGNGHTGEAGVRGAESGGRGAEGLD